ncbi:MAG: SBBP repeat-containing protein, partial [Candidatus Hydrogenedentota bacterium]
MLSHSLESASKCSSATLPRPPRALTCLLLCAASVSAQHDLDWARTIQPATAADGADAFVVNPGLNGQTVVGGDFRGSADLDPGPAAMSVSGAGGSDGGYIITLDATGALVRAATIDGPGDDSVFGLAVSGDGSLYAAGSFESTVDADNGPGIAQLLSLGGSDGFVVKYDPSGAIEWTRTFGSAFDSENAHDIKVAPGGDVVVIGDYFGTIDLDASKINVSALGGSDIYIVRLRFDGTFVWGKSIGSASNEFSVSVAVDGAGDIYVSGGFIGTADFDPDAGLQTLTPAGGGDGFLLKLDSAGNFVWVRQFGGVLNDITTQIALDLDGNVYVGGWVNGEATLAGQSVTARDDDGFLAKFAPDGTLQWTGLFGGPGTDIVYGVAVTPQDTVFVTGTIQDTVDLDPTLGTFEHTVAGLADGYLASLDTDRNFISAGTFGGAGTDQGKALAADADDNVFIAGIVRPPGDVDPGEGAFVVNGPDSFNGLILKLKGPESAPSTLSISGKVESDSGDVLTCATVRAEGMVDGVLVARTAAVNADGTYEMRRLPTSTDGTSPTSYSVQAFAPGFVSEIATVDPADFGGGATATLDFQLAPHTLTPEQVTSGIVVDEQSFGSSTVEVTLAGARVEALSDG